MSDGPRELRLRIGDRAQLGALVKRLEEVIGFHHTAGATNREAALAVLRELVAARAEQRQTP